MINNIFLDVQLNRTTGDVLSISALGCDKSLLPVKQFSALVQSDNLNNISDEELSSHNIQREKLVTAKEPKVVIEAFLKNFCFEDPEHQYIVWNLEPMQILENFVKAYGYVLPNYHRVELQEVMSIIDIDSEGKHDFEYYLEKYGFSFHRSLMHDSNYFIDILSDFYKHIRNCIYDNPKCTSVLLPIVKGSFVFHRTDCYYTENITKFELGRTTPSRIIDGYVPCDSCQNDREWMREIFGDLKFNVSNSSPNYKIVHGIEIGYAKQELDITSNLFEDDTIAKICSYFNFGYKIEPYSISIRTGKSFWIIKHNYSTVDILLHRNRDFRIEKITRKTNRIFDARYIGYHDQKVDLTSLIDVCEYIYKHDKKLK